MRPVARRARQLATAHPRASAAAAYLTRWSVAVLGLVLLITCTSQTVLKSVGAASDEDIIPAPPYPCTGGYVALTFDDGPEPYTDQLDRALRAQGLHATFFLIGRQVGDHPQQAQDLVADGFAVENHTYSHPDLARLSTAAIDEEITRGAAVIEQVTGRKPILVRPPEGQTDAEVRDITAAHGMTEVIWTTDTNDWKTGQTGQQIADAALQVPAGGIILMHDFNAAATRTALTIIAAGLRQRGLCSGRVVPSPTPVTAWDGLSYNAVAAAW